MRYLGVEGRDCPASCTGDLKDMNEDSVQETDGLSAASVQAAHAGFTASLDAVNQAFQALMLLTPKQGEDTEDQPAPRMFTPDMIDSARHVARALKVARLDGLVVAQNLMNYTIEVRNAAADAAASKFSIVPPESGDAEG